MGKYIYLFLAQCCRALQLILIILFCLAGFHGDPNLIPFDSFMFYFISIIGASSIMGMLYHSYYNKFVEIDIQESMSSQLEPDS